MNTIMTILRSKWARRLALMFAGPVGCVAVLAIDEATEDSAPASCKDPLGRSNDAVFGFIASSPAIGPVVFGLRWAYYRLKS